MLSIPKFALATLATLACSAFAGTIGPVDIGPLKDIVITISKDNTINSTSPANFVGGHLSESSVENIEHLRNRAPLESRQSSTSTYFNFGAYPFEKGTVINAYVAGTRQSDGAAVFIQQSGNWYPVQASNGQGNTAIPSNQITISVPTQSNGAGLNVTIPGYMNGRVYYVLNGTLTFLANGMGGQAQVVQPSPSNTQDASYNVFWGFTEFTYTAGGMNMNPTAVDFAGLPNTFAIYNTTGKYQGSGNGLTVNAVSAICGNLQQQNRKDGQPWDQLCKYNNKNQLVRVLSPNILRGGNFGQSNAFNGYYEPYINQVYSRYSSQPLTIQLSNGQTSKCTVSNNQMSCTGDDQSYGLPSTADVFSCSTGPFANTGEKPHKNNVAALCAGFVRSTLLNGGTTPSGPVSSYYSTTPTNWYSYWTHNASFSGIGYAFQYDDVTPANIPNQSGDVNAINPGLIQFIIGGFGFGGYSSGQYAM